MSTEETIALVESQRHLAVQQRRLARDAALAQSQEGRTLLIAQARAEALAGGLKLVNPALAVADGSVPPGVALVMIDIATQHNVSVTTLAQGAYVVHHRLCFSTQTQAALALRGGHVKGWDWEDVTDNSATCILTMPDGTQHRETVTTAMAKRANWKSGQWQADPRNMLQWRSLLRLLRRFCPGLMLGMASEEAADVGPAAPRIVSSVPLQEGHTNPFAPAQIAERATEGPPPAVVEHVGHDDAAEMPA